MCRPRRAWRSTHQPSSRVRVPEQLQRQRKSQSPAAGIRARSVAVQRCCWRHRLSSPYYLSIMPHPYSAPQYIGSTLHSGQLLCSCPAWCFRRMSFQALFGYAQSLLVKLGLLCHVPYLGDYYRPEDQQGDCRRDGLLPKNPYPCLYPSPVCYGLYPCVQGGLQTYDGLEGASAADADLHPSRGDVRFGDFVILALEVTHHLLSDGSEVLNNVGNGLGRIESPHLKCLLSE